MSAFYLTSLAVPMNPML